MFGFGKRKAKTEIQEPAEQQTPEEKQGLFTRLKTRLAKTRSNLTDGLADILLGKKSIDDDLLEE
ncbi:MAG: signal recognition particle-docking protein FtsY, partial [Candidatus Sedimenticola sp. 20ELBAFRAG]